MVRRVKAGAGGAQAAPPSVQLPEKIVKALAGHQSERDNARRSAQVQAYRQKFREGKAAVTGGDRRPRGVTRDDRRRRGNRARPGDGGGGGGEAAGGEDWKLQLSDMLCDEPATVSTWVPPAAMSSAKAMEEATSWVVSTMSVLPPGVEAESEQGWRADALHDEVVLWVRELRKVLESETLRARPSASF